MQQRSPQLRKDLGGGPSPRESCIEALCWRAESASGRRGAGSLPWCPGAAAPSCGRTWSDLAWVPAPPPASPQCSSGSSVPARTLTLTQTHTLPESSTRDPQSLAHAPPPVPHTLHPPARHRISRSAPPRVPPTFPDSGDAGYTLRVALGVGGRPEQQQ